MTETIGKVTLDYSKYPGQDYYCDGQVEDELLEIVQNYDEAEFTHIISQRKKWPVLYHLSPLRENIVDWLPISGEDKVLEVGSGCGAITGAFARKAGSVTCVDLSKKRSLINAYRHKECDNVTIHVGNFKDIEPSLAADYNYICLIGVFEYGQGYIGGETPYEDFLKILMRHLAPGGRLIIAIENKYGLKYFAGCKEDHLGTYFGGIENYTEGGGVRTFGRPGLEKIFKACGVSEYHFYYPYPDYKFLTTLYSDDHLPGKGELSNNLRNFDRDRMLLFHEKDAYDGLIEEGLFPVFSNSYLVVVGEEFEVKYVKYSNDRAPEYCIRTQISQDQSGARSVSKHPMSAQAESHVRNIQKFYDALSKRYEGSGLEINTCNLKDDGSVNFEYIDGTPLSELMDRCLEQGDEEGFLVYFREFVKCTGYGEECPVADFDLIFSNILVSGSQWTLIDYEWTMEEKISAKDLAYRALYCYMLEDSRREKLPLAKILEELQISEDQAKRIREQELDFQSMVNGNERSMALLRGDIGYRITKPQEWIDRYEDSAAVNRVQIYEDRGEGYREDLSYFLPDAYQGENLIEFEIKVSGDVKTLRIDPSMDYCLVKILKLTWNDMEIAAENKRVMVVNGRMINPAKETGGLPSIVFSTKDPNMNLRVERLQREKENRLQVKLEIVRISEAMAQDMAQKSGGFLKR